MADPDEISQFIVEVAQTTGDDEVSQAIVEVLGASGPDQVSQAIVQVMQTSGPDQISQLTIELLRGPEVVPPTDTPMGTFAFGEGLGSTWYIVPQLADSGVEVRDKLVKSVSVRGKVTNATFGVFGYGATDDVDVAAIEAGNGNSRTNAQVLPDTTLVQQSKRFPVNVKNITNHTVRVDGRWDGVGMKDRIDEIVYEVAVQGARR